MEATPHPAFGQLFPEGESKEPKDCFTPKKLNL